MPDQGQYQLEKWMAGIDDRVRKVEQFTRNPTMSGFQLLGDGTIFAQRGIAMGASGGVINEPFEVPPPTGLVLAWGSSFDTVYIDVSWSPPGGYGSDQVVQYLVQATKFSGTGVPIQSIVAGSSTRLEPVEPNTTYIVQVSAITKTGKTSDVATDTILVGGDNTAPAAPTFPSTPVTSAILALAIRWNANTERDVANGKGLYRVVVSSHADMSAPSFDGKTGGTNQWVSGLVADTPYYVRVYAIDSSGNQSDPGTPPGGPWTPAANVTDTSAFAFGGGNIVKNSGLEDATAFKDWALTANGASITIDGATFHGNFGSRSALISGTGDAYISQDVPLQKGTYILSGWVKANAVAKTSSGLSSLGVVLNTEMLTGTFGNFQAMKGALAGGGNVVSAGLGTYDWTRLALKFDVTTAGTLRFYCQRGYTGSTTGSAWFDEIQLEMGEGLTGYAPRPDELGTGVIKTVHIADDQITSPKIITDAVVAGKIAADAVGAREIIAHSITADEILARTITATEIHADTITASEIAANTITSNEIDANTITAANIAAGTITATELAAISLTVGKYIQNAGYVPNSTGWAIQGSGNAEFNNVSIRGTLNAATLGTDLFDFRRPGGNIAARFHFIGSENRFYLGEGAVNVGQYQYYETIQGRQIFRGGIGNNPAWEFTGRTQFTDGAYSIAGYAAGQWGATTGYHVSSNASGTPDTNWGVNFGYDGGSGYTAYLQGYLDSPSRRVGFANMTGGVQQVFIDALSGNPADTRSLTRTGWIVFSDEKSKSDIKPLSTTVESARAKVAELQPIRYKVRHKVGKRDRVSSRHHYGFGAESVKAILPEAVHERVNYRTEGEEPEYGMGIQYDAFIPLLVQATQEQDADIEDIKQLVSRLESRIAALDPTGATNG